jgi:uncharacterized protein YqeY
MSIKTDLDNELKDALRSKDRARLDVIRTIKTEATVAGSEPGFSGEADGDELYQQVIRSFTKRMAKSKAEYESYGERGEAMAAKLGFEIDYLARYLPATPDVGDTAALVAQAIADTGATDIKQAGQVIGHLMKSHQGLDGGVVNRLVREALDAD